LVNDIVGSFAMPEEKTLTASMVNNYVKHGVIPKPISKKYTRDHIACLIVVCILKKVFSIPEITLLIRMHIAHLTTEQAFDTFAESLENSVALMLYGKTVNPIKEQAETIENGLLIERAVLTVSSKLFVQLNMATEAAKTTSKDSDTPKQKRKKA